jgi:DNA-binding NarL/FixJ family response regulator
VKLETISVLLAEDHKIVRKGLRALLELEKSILVVGEAENGSEAVRLSAKLDPEIVIMDIALPDFNGIEAARQIIASKPRTKILMLSAYFEDGYIEGANAIGVSGFLIKQCSPNFLVEAITEIHNGNNFYSPLITERLNVILKRNKARNGFTIQKTNTLSVREFQVLKMIAQGKSNKIIAFELVISIKTVDKHRQNLMRKLSIHDTAGLTRYAISQGIIDSRYVASVF